MNSDDDGSRELAPAARAVMAVVGILIVAVFVLLGAVLWANSGDGPCDGPTVAAGCHRE